MSACPRFFVALCFVFVFLAVGPPARAERIVVPLAFGAEGSDTDLPNPGGDYRDGIYRLTEPMGGDWVTFNEPRGERRTALEFRLPQFGAGTRIDAARLVVSATVSTVRHLAAVRIDGYAGVGTPAPAIFGADNPLATLRESVTGADQPRRLTVDATRVVRDLYSFRVARPSHAGFLFRLPDLDPAAGTTFSIQDRSDLPNTAPPVLEIDFTPIPEPGAGVLALPAALGGGLLATRRRNHARAS